MAVIVAAVTSAVTSAAYLLHKYADRKHCPWYVLLLVWATWSLGLVFFFALPFDVSSTWHERCVLTAAAAAKASSVGLVPAPVAQGGWDDIPDVTGGCVVPPWGAVPAMTPFWSATYWTSMLLGYFMSDFLKEVIASGAFTLAGRVKASLRSGAMFYIPAAVLGLIFLTYQLSTGTVTTSEVRGYCKAAANAFSLGLVILMLGYGLVEVPRYLWNKGDVEGQLRYLHFRVSEYHEASETAAARLGEAVASLELITEQVAAAECVGDTAALRRLCARVALHAEPSERAAVLAQTTEASERLRASLVAAPRVADIENLNFRTKEALTAYRRARANYSRTLARTVTQTAHCDLLRQLDDVSWDEQRESARSPNGGPGKKGVLARARLVFDRRYLRVTVEPVVWRVLAVGCALLSLLVLVCESTIIFRDIVNLSILSWLLFLDPAGGVLFLVLFAVPLFYITACVYFAFFRVKLFGFYALHSGQNSDYGSLLFNGTYMCRLAPGIVYNYLNLLHEPHRAEESGVAPAFLQALGSMDVVPFFGTDYYNDFAPIAIIVLCGITYLNLFSHCGALCGGKSFQFDDTDSSESTDNGARIVAEELRRRSACPSDASSTASVTSADGKRALNGGGVGTPHRALGLAPVVPGSPDSLRSGASAAGWRAKTAGKTATNTRGEPGSSLPAALPDLHRKPKGRYSQLDDSPGFGGATRDPSEQELADLEALSGLKGFGSL
ncbi:LMBR1-like membrane protein-domain-containing protein [Pavlovales sp. CCMP2436]|nr:LMBR1-like membrane protein-domain-containing protein [Pavlovales sp. CCMP2436]|mmetsp:Transcript_1902/g.4970  ORF Transcript_1902/g.4970 Transcript_1902/m.4970 type:complete len:726 (+) Transcript_1902:73-2250(+)